jgi:hypothetical protein
MFDGTESVQDPLLPVMVLSTREQRNKSTIRKPDVATKNITWQGAY